jgi:hypothetical protein
MMRMIQPGKQEPARKYCFLPAARGIRRAFRALWALVGLMAMLIGGVALAALVARFADGVPAPARYDALALIVTAVILYLAFRSICSVCATYVTSSDIALDSTGVTLYLTDSRSRLVPWENVDRDGIRPVKPRPMFKPVTDDVAAYAVPAKKLSLLHVLTGYYYRVGFSGVFIVHSDHEGYQQIIEELKAGSAQ